MNESRSLLPAEMWSCVLTLRGLMNMCMYNVDVIETNGIENEAQVLKTNKQT